MRARPSCSQVADGLTSRVRPIPHSGGVRHSRPLACSSDTPSASPSPMSCSSMSVYGQISWKRCSGCAASRRVTYLGTWQATQLAW
ncbi:Uncharacterised protein [Bordetella pertussis]|nr:Uncharacterised protein [Bordetella pertussis]